MSEASVILNVGKKVVLKSGLEVVVHDLTLENILSLSDLLTDLIASFKTDDDNPTGTLTAILKNPLLLISLRELAGASTGHDASTFVNLPSTDWVKLFKAFREVIDWEELKELFTEMIPQLGEALSGNQNQEEKPG